MKKSFMLFVALCGVIALLVAPGIAVADTFDLTAYRDFSLFNQVVFNVVDLSNAQQQHDPVVDYYTPLYSNWPGWVDPSFGLPNGKQHTYVIDLTTPIGGQCQEVPGLSPITGVSGLVVLYRDNSLALPTDLAGWLAASKDSNFLSNVAGVVAFVPGVSTAVVYVNCTPPPQVPEPVVLLLLGSGLVALAGMRRVIKK
ncbi:MAG: PEP-CTERM sorting domain-containing protein [Thermodesulfobacteriota bacterium]|jgi:hypothetical protein